MNPLWTLCLFFFLVSGLPVPDDDENCDVTWVTVRADGDSATSPRADGRCGKDFRGATCDPKGNFGGCCSGPWGFCGSTPTHCLVSNGCQNGCTTDGTTQNTDSTGATTNQGSSSSGSTSSTSATSPRPDGRCGKDFGGATCDPKGNYGGCCSGPWGQCGSTPTHCLVSNGCQNGCTDAGSSNATSTGSSANQGSTSNGATSGSTTSGSSTAPRSDGRCGKDFGGATCDPKGNYGGCCSGPWGQCGSTTTHCLVSEGCQNGCTDGSDKSATSVNKRFAVFE